MRKQINGLSLIVQDELELNPFDKNIFVFCNKMRNRLKILYWDKNGFCLWLKMLKKIKDLYKIEKQIKKDGLTEEEIVKVRKESSVTVLNDIKSFLDARVDSVPPKSLLGKAINYTLKFWDRLIEFINHACLSLDNNLVENAIRPFVVGRNYAGYFQQPGKVLMPVPYSIVW